MHQQEPAAREIPRHQPPRADPPDQSTSSVVQAEHGLEPGRLPLNHNSIHPKCPSCGDKARNWLWPYRRSAFSPKAAEIPLFAGTIKMQQIFLVAGRVVRKPLVKLRYANLMEQREAIAGGL